MTRKLLALLLALTLLCPVALAEGNGQTVAEMMRDRTTHIRGGYALFAQQKLELEQELEKLREQMNSLTDETIQEKIDALMQQLIDMEFGQPDEPVPGMLATDRDNLLTLSGNPEFPRAMIVSIEFRADLSDAPEDAWDASACGDGSVMAWVQEVMGGYSLTIAADGPVKAPVNSRYLFANYSFVKQISFAGAFDTSGTIYMSSMFKDCKRLTEADMSGLDLSSVTDLSSLLSGCPGTPEVNIEIPDASPKFDGLG